MSNGMRGHRRVRFVAMLAMLGLVGFTVWLLPSCSQKRAEPTKTASEKKDGDVHVKVDLPDTITIKP